MAEFVVNTDQLRSNADRISALQRELDSVAVRLGAMQLGSVLQIKASTALVARVGDCKWAAVHQSDNLGRLARGLDDIAQLYDTVEKNLSDPKTQTQAQAQGGHGGQGESEEESGFDLLEGLRKLLEAFGEESAVFSGIASLFRFGQFDAQGIADGLKNLVSTIGLGSVAIFGSNGNSPIWKNLLGFNASGVDGLGSSWQDFLDDMNLGKQTTTAGKVGTVCKWAGYALTFVSEGVENYAEHGGFTARFWGETAVEGAVSVGMSIGAGVLMAAALPASAPAIVVGAAGAAVVWAVDSVVEHFTGQNIGEWVGDAVCDGVEVAGEFIGNAAATVADAAADAVDAVADAAASVANAASNAVDSFCGWVGGLFG